jgi:hypothetical protein
LIPIGQQGEGLDGVTRGSEPHLKLNLNTSDDIFTTYHLVTLSPAALRSVFTILHPQERRAGLSLKFNGADEFRRLIQCPRNLAT